MSFYTTTPIYYVNDRPHIGHVYTTTLADVVARFHRLCGNQTFFLTGTDEHATKVVEAAQERGLTAQVWADQNAAVFRETFDKLQFSHDDFIRTSEARHKTRVERWVKQLVDSGDVYLGEYEGWYDQGQEEYIPESKAKELDFKSPINKKPLVRKREENFFFKLSAYSEALIELLESERFKVQPPARKNEVLARVHGGLNDVPISRTGVGDWGIRVPGHDQHTIYVWIDALLNYLSAVDTDDLRQFWPPQAQWIGKDILWFHAVIWPAMLMALKNQPDNGWIELPKVLHAHSFWTHEGDKMSKSMGNFVDLQELERYIDAFGLDALRYFLVMNGPLSATDADFAASKFIEVYNGALANGVGNCHSRVSNMVGKYFEGRLPEPSVEESSPLKEAATRAVALAQEAMAELALDRATQSALHLVGEIDSYIQHREPFKLIKQEGKRGEVATILYNSSEALRIASLLLWPVLPGSMEKLWSRFGHSEYAEALGNRKGGRLGQWTQWGGLQAGTPIQKGEALFPRFQAAAL